MVLNRARAPLAALASALLAVSLLAALAPAAIAAAPAAPTARQIERFWTPGRMAAARPLEMTVGRDGRHDVRLGSSYSVVATPEALPYAWNGKLYVRQGKNEGFCSATAIDSPSRSLVLTAGHCVNTGPRGDRPGIWSSYMEFVPGYNLGATPYGAWTLSGKPRALPEWTRKGNPDYDLGAFLVEPNDEGVPLADAVGGGVRIVTGLGHRQRFETYGYPGGTERMRTCASGFAGEDPLTKRLPGPDTVSVRCHWAPGASGGAWLIEGGTAIDGINAYLHYEDKKRTFGPYFSKETVGRLVAGW